VERVALTTRRELRRALAEYQVAEGDLRVEVAKSWPDLQLGPGLFFDHGVGKWTIALGLPSVPLNRNRGPIAEAEARREVAARRFAEVQEQVLGEVTMALAACRSAGEEMASLDLRSTRKRVELAEAAYRRGEIGRLELEFVRLELERATRRLIEAGGRLTAAGLSLEHAVGIWTGAPSAPLERGGLQ
jgi:outer membrane protein TolC